MMSKICLHFFVVIYIFGCLMKYVSAQIVPAIPCPNYFQYLNTGGGYIGKVTIENLPLATTKVEAQFMQHEPIRTGFSGSLSLFDDLQKTQSNLEHGKPITYRVDFPNPLTLPKLTRIAVNGETVCSGSGIPPPSTTFNLYRTFIPSVTTTFNVQSTKLSPTPITNVFDSIPNDNVFIQQVVIPSNTQTALRQVPQMPIPQTLWTQTTGQQNSWHQMPKPQTLWPQTSWPQTPSPQTAWPQTSWPHTPSPQTAWPQTPKPPTPRPQGPVQQTLKPQTSQPQTPIPQMPRTQPVVNKVNANVACGQEGGGLTPLIVGGNDFPRGKFPWLTAIYIRQGANLKFTCGGSLISSRTIITAAQCFMESSLTADRIVAFLGRYNLFSTEAGAIQSDIESFLKHPEFNPIKMADADVALLNTREPIIFTEYISPICLWSQTSNANDITGQKGFVAGWGSDNNNRGVTPMPQIVESMIVNEAECLRSSEVNRALTTSRTICAGNRDGTGPCVSDTGGGLMVLVGSSWMIRGIMSGGQKAQGKCNLDEFVVYCDIAKHMSWVQKNMLH